MLKNIHLSSFNRFIIRNNQKKGFDSHRINDSVNQSPHYSVTFCSRSLTHSVVGPHCSSLSQLLREPVTQWLCRSKSQLLRESVTQWLCYLQSQLLREQISPSFRGSVTQPYSSSVSQSHRESATELISESASWLVNCMSRRSPSLGSRRP